MAISDRITSIEEHLRESYQELEGIGIDTTEVNKNLENIPKLIDGYWETLSKVTGEGTSITLDSTKEGKMKMDLKGNTSQATLPSEYTAVDYIQSSGTQYINTGHILNANDVIDITYDYVADGFVFGSRTSNTSNYSGITNESTANFNIRMGNTLVYAYNSRLTGTNSIHIESGNIKINGEVVSTTTYGSNFYSGNLYLFALNQNGTAQLGTYSRNRIRYFKIKDVIELIPCYRNSDNEIGMYDLVNNVFYTNAGTGAFTYGAVATFPNPNYPQDIHVVSGDNTINVCGKNLLPNNVVSQTLNGLTITKGTDGSLLINGTSTATTKIVLGITNLSSGTYTSSTHKEGTVTDNCYLRTVDTTTESEISGTSFNIYSSNTKTYTLSENKRVQFDFYTGGNRTFTNFKIYPMAESGSTATTYEAYQSQSYPIDLRGTNLFEGELEKGGIDANTGANDDRSDLYNKRIRTKEYILIDDTKKILSYNLTNGQWYGYFYDSSKTFLGITSGWGTSPLAFTPISNTKYVRFVWRKSNNATINVNEISSIELRNEAIELCKIGTYQDSIKKSTGKNLFNGETELGAYDNNGNKSFNNNCRRTIDFIEVKPSTTYIFSRNGSTFNCKYFYYDKNKNYISSQVLNSSFTTPDNCYYLNFFSDQLVSDYANLMLNEGTTALPYEPYGKVWYVNKQIGKVVLDGSENWNYQSQYPRFQLTSLSPVPLNDSILFCSHYKKGQTADANNVCSLASGTGYSQFLVHDERYTTKETYNTWLSSNNVSVYYVLKTPTYTEITDSTLLSQLEALNGAKSYTTQTNISQENNDLPFILDVTALKELTQ